MQGMANGVIDIINGVINAINLIPGVAIDPLEHLTFAATAAAEEEAAKQQRANNLQAAKDEAAAKAAEREAQLQADAAQWRAEAEAQAAEAAAQQEELGATEDFWTQGAGAEGFGDYSQFEDPGAGGVPTNVTGGKLDSVDEVGISDEDLKYLRDIAQAEYINQYTTQRPVVYANFGDVHETADVNQVIEVLEEAVAGAYASSLDRG
jgi:flagellar biosynthesis GTPase FlhF